MHKGIQQISQRRSDKKAKGKVESRESEWET